MDRQDAKNEELNRVLRSIGRVSVAVSGGVDSLTLAAVAHNLLGSEAHLFHAVSPAVPLEATQRTQTLSKERGWDLSVLDAGEFSDGRYVSNPSDRCFFCKSHLYASIASVTDRQVVSGANVDDLHDYRPGLEAAKDHGVRHPFVEAGLGKAEIRWLARTLDLGDIAELPASPCLSSRIETGLAIDPAVLALVHEAENHVATTVAARHIRCRVRAAGIVVELDGESLSRMNSRDRTAILGAVTAIFQRGGHLRPVFMAPYRMGSAFLR